MMSEKACLECKNINHWFGSDPADLNKVLFNVNLKIIRGEIVSLVGPSGCGKSTLLRAIVGTHPPCEGTVNVYSGANPAQSRVIVHPTRDIGIVYQRYSLFPFMTAQQNVAFGLMLDQTSIPFRLFNFFNWRRLRRQHLEEAAELLEKVGLKKAIKLYPHEMSGGMCQRVAIAQALIMKPEILLLDEPFGALDEATREDLQQMLLSLYNENLQAKKEGRSAPYTVMLVTHELREAIFVGDRVIALSQYWNWKEQGFEKCPGATILYDKVAPVYEPGQRYSYEDLLEQQTEIRKVAFDSDFCQPPEDYRQFWDQLETGHGKGVLKDG